MEGVGVGLVQSLRQQISPVVMVLTTARVEESCQRNDLSFIELFRPFCSFGNINVPVRTASDQPYRLTEFYIRMFYPSDICQPRAETAEDFLVQVVNENNDEISLEVEADAEENELMQMITQADRRTPSFQKYSREFMRTLAFSEHEAVDHPVACVLVVSSSDASPIDKFLDLYNSDQLPALLNEGAMDPKLLKLYVMLHDNQEGPVDRANEILLEMRSVFGVNNCRILCINSASPDLQGASSLSNEDMWESGLLRPMNSVGVLVTSQLVENQRKEARGRYITKSDMEELTDLVLDLSVKHVIPSMEVKIRTLHQQVSATRKGLKNQIKNLWWRKGKDDVPDVSNGPLYSYSSMESQIRVLADYAFMLRDYELAMSNYRLLSSDYKTDKAWKRYAGVQEMIGLSLFMLDQSRRESELCMETAINYYQTSYRCKMASSIVKSCHGGSSFVVAGSVQKGGPSSAPYATRSALWLAEMHKAKTQYREAAVVLFRASAEETSTRSGLLLEQAAYCYLHTAPPMLRKYGFHLVLAGNQYTNSFQMSTSSGNTRKSYAYVGSVLALSMRKLATHAYRSALMIYGDQNWKYINDHVHFHLARLSTLLGNHAYAVQFFKKVIACSHQSPANQAKFLSEFLFVIQSTAIQGDIMKLDLPMVDVEHVHVHFEDQRTYASSAAASVPEEEWSSLEEGVVPGPDRIFSTWLDPKKVIPKSAADFNICVAGEEIGVDVEFRNPLQMLLDVSAVSLVCNFTKESSTKGLGQGQSTEVLEATDFDSSSTGEGGHLRDDVRSEVKLEDSASESDLIVSEEEFPLKPGEKIVVRLKVTPLQAGILKVVGVKWTLSRIAAGRRDFAILGLRNKKSKNSMRDEPPPHQRLKFHVLRVLCMYLQKILPSEREWSSGHVPRLDVSLHEVPGRVNTGEVHRLVLELSNPSAATLKTIKLKTSHPLFLLVGESGDLDQEFPGCLEVQREPSSFSGIQDAVNIEQECSISGYIFSFPKGTVLEGGSTLLWPLWLHASKAGTLSLNTVVYYEPDKPITGLLYRTVRMTHSLQVLPSLKAAVQITPSPLQLQQFLLRLDIENMHSAESFWLRQVSCAGNQWSLAPLPPPVLGSPEESEGAESVDDRAAYLSASVCPSQLLPPSQNLSLFFKLLNLGSGQRPTVDGLTSNIKLGPPSSTEPLIDITTGPLPRFLLREKLDQPKPDLPFFLQRQLAIPKEDERDSRLDDQGGAVDILLISEQQDGMITEKQVASSQEKVRVVVHDICHCSVQSPVPLVWVMEGPRCVGHDFATEPFCGVSFLLTVRNCSNFDASVKVETFDMNPVASLGLTLTQEKRVGWFPLALVPVSGEGSASESGSVPQAVAVNAGDENFEGILPCGPYMWCNLRSTTVPLLRAGASARIPLCVTFFAPGIYELSRYQVSWSLLENHTDSRDGECAGKGKLFRPQKLSKTTETTFASGFGPSSDKPFRVSSTRGGPKKICKMTGMGVGHPLLFTVLQGHIPLERGA